MKLSTIQSTLAQLEMRPTKSLGQNFLHDQNLAEWIVNQLELTPEDHVVEIGPGLGALTEFVVPRCASVTVVEKDGRLAEFLKTRFTEGVEILHQDAVEYDVRPLFLKGGVKVLGNLPYYVSSQILFNFTDEPSPVTRLVFTVQRELAERLAAEPSNKDYGALTLVIQRRWKVKYLRTLPGSVFTPVPKVDSAVVGMVLREPGELPDCDGVLFNRLVKQGFSQRRKQLRKMLADYCGDWEMIVRELSISETARAEELSLLQWIRLTNLVSGKITAAQDVHGEKFDIVDEKDNVISVATRHEAHTQKLLHRAVHVFVFNKKEELFLQKRSRWKDAHPGKWDSSAAGHVNAGDDYAVTAAREVTEEMGVEVPVEEIAYLGANENTGYEFIRLYRALNNGPFFLPASEIETGGFFPVPLVKEWIGKRPGDFASGFIECFRAFERMDGDV